jgi:acetyltransferase-like isoleucine patch superfamily enzyme
MIKRILKGIFRRIQLVKELFQTNLLKTLYFNFKMFPLKTGIKLPIFFYGKTCFRSLKGNVIIKHPIYTGMIKVGITNIYVDHCIPENIWGIYGKLIINGPLKIGRGSYVHIAQNGTLTLGARGWYGSQLKLICFDKITFGEQSSITWDCQFYDTSFHYIELVNQNSEVKPLTSPIIIGDRVWVGNRSTISKGAIIPSDTIIASNSLVNKNYSALEPYTMLAGQPAIPKSYGVKRIFDSKVQALWDEKYNYSRNRL